MLCALVLLLFFSILAVTHTNTNYLFAFGFCYVSLCKLLEFRTPMIIIEEWNKRWNSSLSFFLQNEKTANICGSVVFLRPITAESKCYNSK